MKLALAVVALCSLAFVTPVFAAPAAKVYADIKMQITPPDGWKVQDAKNGITMIGAPKDDAGILVFPIKTPTPEAVERAVADLLGAMGGTAITWDPKAGKDTVNGLPLFARKGTGTFDAKPHDLVTVLVVNGSNGLVFLSVVPHDRKDAYKADLTATVTSIKATK